MPVKFLDDEPEDKKAGRVRFLDPEEQPSNPGPDRTIGQIVTDLGASGLQGLVSGAKLPAMALDRAATGQWVGPGVEALSEFEASVNDQKSPQLRAKEQAMQERTAAAGQAVRDRVGDEGFLPNTARMLAEFGVGAWESVKDPALLSSQIAQQGAMLGLSRMGGLATNKVAQTAATALPAAAATRAGQAALAGAGTAGAVGTGAALQASDIGTDAYQRLLALPESMWRQQPEYVELAASIGPDAAKSRLASDKAFSAALQAGAASILSSALPGGASMERALVGKAAGGVNPLKTVAQSVVGEARQEGIEEGFGAAAANEAVRTVNPAQDRIEGVGGAAGQGAALGGIMGGGSTAGGIALDRWRNRGEAPPAATPDLAPATPGAAQVAAPVAADEILGRTEPLTAAEEALRTPRPITDLDRVQEIDSLVAGMPDNPDAAGLLLERGELTKDWPTTTPGAAASFSTEAGARVDGQYALIEADALQASHDTDLRPNPRYPTELQPRDRTRAASEAQISSIAMKIDPTRLGQSPTAADGAPIIGADGLVESGNARTIALQRVYRQNGQKAVDYRTWLRDNAAQFGLAPEQVEGLRQPVLVRVRTTPVNRAEFARQANASTVAAMSPLEQARADARRIDIMDDLAPDDDGDFVASREFIRRFVGRLPGTEQSGMIDADGRLSSSGYARVRNAVLAKAYGDSPVLARMVESMDDNLRNVSKALMIAAPRVAQARQAIGDGRLFDADLTPHLVGAVEELGRIKESGTSIQDALAQTDLVGDKGSPESGELLQFLADNIRRPRRMAEFITSYFDALSEAGDPAQGSLLGEVTPPTTGDLMAAARRSTEGVPRETEALAQDAGRRLDRENPPTGQRPAGQPEDAPGGGRGNQGNEGAANDQLGPDWVSFPPETGTLGVPRADMPQVKMKDRGAMVRFLKARGIEHEIVDLDPATLKPTQAEFSRSKVEKAKGAEGNTATILSSSDGYVLDGHHRWLSQAANGEPVRSLRFNAPIEQLMAAVFEFPSTSRGTGATGEPSMDARQMAADDFKAALGALGDFLTRHQRAAIVDENTPGLMPILKDLAGAAIRMIGTDLRAIVKWVREKMKDDPRVKPAWNKVTASAIRKAAEQALVDLQNEPGAQLGLFDSPVAADAALQGDLFGSMPEQPAAPRQAMIDGRPYDPKRDNFTAPSVDSFMDADVLERANGYVDRYYKDRPPVALSAEDRARAEAMLRPLIDKAGADKPTYDQKIIDIARRAGAVGQMLAPVKGMKRAAEKLALEEKFDVGGMKDVLRSTIVVSSYADAQAVVTEIEAEFKLLRAPKNRTNTYALKAEGKDVAPQNRRDLDGYTDVMLNVVMPSGVIAEIQINVQEMLAAKDGQGHKLYEAMREAPKDSALGREIEGSMREFYNAAFDAAESRQAAADAKKSASVEGSSDSRRGKPLGTSEAPSDAMPNTPPSGNLTRSSPPNESKNSQPGGNLSGIFTSSPSGPIVAEDGNSQYDINKEGQPNDSSSTNDRGGSEKSATGPVRKPEGKRATKPARRGSGEPDLLGFGESDAGSAPDGEVGRPGADGVRGPDGDGAGNQPRGPAGSGAGVPAGRDIGVKSGLNYRFSDDEISPPGSWFKRATNNVAAVELVKKLQAENRKATREEQAVLAQWVGWGASEVANKLFGAALEKSRLSIEAYRSAQKALEGGASEIRPDQDAYWTTYQRLAHGPERLSYRQAIPARLVTPKAFGVESDTLRWFDLRERLNAPFPMAGMLADKIKEAADLELGLAGKDKPTADGQVDMDDALGAAAMGMAGPEIRMSRSAGGGMDVAALRQVERQVSARLPGLPKVEVLASPAEAPEALRKFIEGRGAMGDAEGALFDGKIYLFASGMADATRAEHVLAEHEAAHAGLRGILGSALKQTMQAIYNQNASVRRAATPLLAQKMSLAEAVEEVIVEIPSADLVKLRGWRALVVRTRDALRARGMHRIADQLDGWLAGHLSQQQKADLFVADLVREARGFVMGRQQRKLADDAAAQEKWLTGRAKGLGFAGIEDMLERDYPAFERLAAEWRQRNPAEALLSRATTPGAAPAGDAAQRAEAIIQNAASTPKPIDRAVRMLTRVTGLERLTTATYGLGARLIERLVPEHVKAGVVSDYGVPEAVIDRRAGLQGAMREQIRQTGKILEKLATLTRAESRVAYEWMSGDDLRAADDIMADLPEESVAVLRQVRQMIDELSREAVRLGQLEPEAFERHRFAYLRRSYFKHAQEFTSMEKSARERALTILGDQYKGRGMVDKAPMRQIQNIAPEWWRRKVVEGQADTSLKGQKFERLERRAKRGVGTQALDGMGENTRPGKLLEIHYWPAGESKPAKYADWEPAGTWEVRGTKGADAIMWRDFTKDERVRMGEIDEARYAIGKTLQRMVHDVEVGRYLEWIEQNYSKPELPEGGVVAGDGESTTKAGGVRQSWATSYAPGEWVKVPSTVIPGTQVARYGKLAGRWVEGPVWNDIRQIGGGMRVGPQWWQDMLRMWKISKTALSPGVHTNNIMSNMVMADWHDVSAGHVAKALRIILAARSGDSKGALGRTGNLAGRAIGAADREASTEVVARYEASGGAIGGWVTQEIANEQLTPIVEALQRELASTAEQSAPAEIGIYSALQHALHARFPRAWEAFKASRPASIVATDGKNLIDLYQAEDDVFRLAAWLKAKEDGKSDADAGKIARRSFLDYSINAPWVQALRQTALPFVSFTYRAVPMLLETAAKRPHKLLKLGMSIGLLNALGVMLAGGDDDEERKLLPEEKAGRVWGLVPKLVRMPWNDDHGSPVYLDIRRWIPVGDVLDVGQGNAAVPLLPSMMPGGPMAVIGEIIANKSLFTGKPITLKTDTVTEKAGKVMDHLWKAAAPNLLGVPGTYATTGVTEAAQGRTDTFGREMSVTQAVVSTMGVKLGSYPADVLRRNIVAKREAEAAEIDKEIAQLKRQRMTQRIDQQEFEEAVRRQVEKKNRLYAEAAARLN